MLCTVKKSEIYIIYITSSSSNQNMVYAVKNGEEKKIREHSNDGVEAQHITAYGMIYYCTKL